MVLRFHVMKEENDRMKKIILSLKEKKNGYWKDLLHK